MIDFTLTHFVLDLSSLPSGTDSKLLYNFDKGSHVSYDTERKALKVRGKISFLSYFNSFVPQKFDKCFDLNNLEVNFIISGDSFTVTQQNYDGKEIAETNSIRYQARTCEQFNYEFDISKKSDLISFNLETQGTVFIKEAIIKTRVEARDLNEVKLLIATTTYKKEKYITANLKKLHECMEQENSILKDVDILVVDNGQTLKEKDIYADGKRIILKPSPNVGGAGGFAQGMIYSVDNNYSHVLLMDDDVSILLEAIFRTIALLKLMRKSIRDKSIINGAMFGNLTPNVQHEDVAILNLKTSLYSGLKHKLDMSNLNNVYTSENTDVSGSGTCGAWWYSCIPTSLIKKHGVAMPFFVRCDDVEFGIRVKPNMITLAGICVWHDNFEGRINYAADCYQFNRNFLIMCAIDNLHCDHMLMMRFRYSFKIHLRSFSYNGAEALIDAIDDYMKGPKWLLESDGAKVFKEHLDKNEKLIPVENLSPEQKEAISDYVPKDPGKKTSFIRIMGFIPYDPHKIKDNKLKDEYFPIYYWMGEVFGNGAYGHNKYIAVSHDKKNAIVRNMDKKRWRELRQRFKNVMNQYKRNKKKIKKEWQESAEYLRSSECWVKYIENRKH